MQEAPDPRRHPRTVMATDTEMAAHPRARRGRWHAHLAVCLPTGGGPRAASAIPGVAPEAVLARLERIETAVLVLAEIERQRLAERGEEEGWDVVKRGNIGPPYRG